MSRVIVVTGTDTEVGKTFVTAALIYRLRQEGLTVRAVKPVESGVLSSEPEGREDGVILAAAAGQTSPGAAVQRYRAPLAPTQAAEIEGIPIEDDSWAPLVADLADEADLVFVEAAGGLFSPLSNRFDALSLAKHLGADMLVVAGDKLGAINHSRLTLTALRYAGFSDDLSATHSILGFIFSEPATADDSTGSNAAAFAQASGFPRTAVVTRHPSYQDATSELDGVLPWLVD